MSLILRPLLLLLFAASSLAATAGINITNTRVEHLEEPLGLDTRVPRFSWQTAGDKRDIVQNSYRVIVSSSREKAERCEGDLWDSGDIESREQVLIPYGGKNLKDNSEAWWRVKARTNKGSSPWSVPSRFGIGLLCENRWNGRWIGLESDAGDNLMKLHTELPARYLRKEFKLGDKPVRRATAYVAGLGLYRLFINGEEIGADELLKPIPSDYRRTVYYNTFDVTRNLDTLTAVGVILGNGRYFPARANKPHKTPYFGLPTCRLNIIVEYADGSRQRLATDESWRVTDNGPIRANNEYDGETYDAGKEFDGWTLPGFDDSAWKKAERSAIPYGTLRAQPAPNMRPDTLGTPIEAKRVGGRLILDFGENMAGHIVFRPKGAPGDTIRIRYAEKLNTDGTLCTANLRDALSTDTYVCSGKEDGSIWSPSFTYHGFRYAEVSGMPDAAAGDFAAVRIGDPVKRVGFFECSDSTLNRIVRNAARGILSNYKGMPVDCPQRNERQPWLGDRTVGALGETYLFDNAALYSKWVRDICEAQREDGCIPDVAPAFWNYYTDNVTWPAALPFVCDMLLTRYADDKPMRYAYPYIAKWMNHILDEYSRDGIVSRDRYGDWCVPPERLDLIHSEDPARKTDGALIATAYTVECLRLLEKFANIAGNTADASRWAALRGKSAKAFNDKFLTNRRGTSPVPGHALYPDSVFYGNNTVTANILPLAFGIVPDSLHSEVAKNVVSRIITRDNCHVSCGVIGISWLLRALSEQGFGELAWLLATNSTYPSWGYMAENGATTIWELWNGDKAKPWMNSGNHVMLLGDLLTWCFRELGGVHPGNAANHFILRPDFSIPDCEWAKTEVPTPYGPVQSSWNKTLTHCDWEVTLPPNTTATICLPDRSTKEIGSGHHALSTGISTPDPAIVSDEFLYTSAPFPQCHAATIVETRRGDLVAAYFGGTHERHPDVCVWVSRKPQGSDKWEAPVLAADGVFRDADTISRKACWNPVLFEMPDGELWLFFKIGSKVADWTGWLVKSKDGGRTWSTREPLPEGFLGPVKNKPELIGDRLICPSSTESGGWKLHFEILDLSTGKWKYVGPVAAERAYRTDDLLPDGTPSPRAKMKPIDCIQPSILKLSDGRLMVLMRTRNGRLAASYSSDNGDSWSDVTLTELPSNQSGTDAVTLPDGRHALVYNDFSTLPSTKKGPRTPLRVALSDDGKTWHNAVTLEDSPISQYSYPAVIVGRDGSLHIVYTWRRERIAYKRLILPKD